MILTKTFEKFAEGTPVCVMIRGGLEYALPETFVNQMFERTACRQYTRSLLFSQIVDLMGSVVCQVFPSVNAAYQKQQDRFAVSRRALYDKINLVEPGVTRQLVRQTARRLGPVVRELQKRGERKSLLGAGLKTAVISGC